MTAGAGQDLHASLADLALTSLEADYLQTVAATRHPAVADFSHAEMEEEGYQPLADDDDDDWEHDRSDGRIVTAVDNSDVEDASPAVMAPPVGQEDDFGEFETAPASEATYAPRDIEMTEEHRKLITNIMSGITLKDAPAWASNFGAAPLASGTAHTRGAGSSS